MTQIAGRFILVIAVLVTALAFACQSKAQSLGFAVDSKGKMTPAMTLPVFDLDETFGFKVRSSIVAFGGSTFEGGQIAGGGAWVFEFPVAKGQNVNLRAFFGPSLTFEKGVPAKLGAVFGVRF